MHESPGENVSCNTPAKNPAVYAAAMDPVEPAAVPTHTPPALATKVIQVCFQIGRAWSILSPTSVFSSDKSRSSSSRLARRCWSSATVRTNSENRSRCSSVKSFSVPAVKGLFPASVSFTSRLRLAVPCGYLHRSRLAPSSQQDSAPAGHTSRGWKSAVRSWKQPQRPAFTRHVVPREKKASHGAFLAGPDAQ